MRIGDVSGRIPMVAGPAGRDDHGMAIASTSHARDGKLAVLASLPVFACCRPPELVELGRAFEMAFAVPSELLQRQWERPAWWTVLAEGSALATVDGLPAMMLRPGDSFGEPRPLSSAPSGVTVMALTPVVLLTLAPRRWPALVERFPALVESAASAVRGGVVQRAAPGPRKKRSKSPSTPAPWSVMPPSTTMV